MGAKAGILERIVAHKRVEVATRQQQVDLARLERSLATAPATRPFTRHLRQDQVAVIAEVKRASPSKGLFAPDLDAVAQARVYEQGGAAAISVLTDQSFFHGSLDDLRTAASAVSLPLLRKDFVLDRYQLVEARLAGASLALLIVAMLDRAALRRLLGDAAELGLEALVEVHTEAELEEALAAGAGLIGINNRDLDSFAVSLETTERLRALIPKDIYVVSESGIHGAADIQRLRASAVHAVLVGEALVRAADGLSLLRDLVRAGQPIVALSREA